MGANSFRFLNPEGFKWVKDLGPCNYWGQNRVVGSRLSGNLFQESLKGIPRSNYRGSHEVGANNICAPGGI